MQVQLSNLYSHIVLRQAPEHEFKLLTFMYNIINNIKNKFYYKTFSNQDIERYLTKTGWDYKKAQAFAKRFTRYLCPKFKSNGDITEYYIPKEGFSRKNIDKFIAHLDKVAIFYQFY